MRTYKIGDVINTKYGRGTVIHHMTIPYVYQVSIKLDDASEALRAQMVMWGAKEWRPAVLENDIIEEQTA